MGFITLKSPVGHQKMTRRRGRGPGSGLGKTSGRGHKGQKARAGGGVRPGFEGGQMPLYRRLPKRGFKSPFKKIWTIVHLSRISKIFKDGDVVDKDSLLQKGLIKKKNSFVKILKDCDNFDKKLKFKVDGVSKSCREIIERSGSEILPVTETLKKE